MFFEVHLPSPESKRYETQLQIEASSWRSALFTGLAQSNDVPDSLDGFYVDIGEEEIRVTDPNNRRVIRIVNIDETQAQKSQIMKAMTGQFRAIPTAEPRPRRKSTAGAGARSVGFEDKATGAFRPIVSTEIKKPNGESGIEGRVLQETVQPKPEPTESIIELAAPVAEAVAETPAELESISETALEDVFLEITTIFEPEYAMEDAIDFVLNLATKYIPSGTGGVLFASDQADHLYFAACRGRGKKKLLQAELSIRAGVPAHSLRDGLALSITDPENDDRHTDELAKKSGLKPDSLCCAPIQHGDRAFGVILLVNRQQRSFYSQYDSNIASYIGSQMGKYIQDQLDAAPLE